MGTGTDKYYYDFNTVWEVEDKEVVSGFEVGGSLLARDELKEVGAPGLVEEGV